MVLQSQTMVTCLAWYLAIQQLKTITMSLREMESCEPEKGASLALLGKSSLTSHGLFLYIHTTRRMNSSSNWLRHFITTTLFTSYPVFQLFEFSCIYVDWSGGKRISLNRVATEGWSQWSEKLSNLTKLWDLQMEQVGKPVQPLRCWVYYKYLEAGNKQWIFWSIIWSKS